jgi:hypothetical protein
MTTGRALALVLLATGLGAVPLDGQTPADGAPPTDSTAVDRSWSIDIAQREIVESSFGDEASVVAVDEGGRWYVCAGAAVTAEEVRINLTNVQAEVHLRADLGRLRDLFNEGASVTASGSEALPGGPRGTSCESSTGPVPVNQSPD